MAKNKVAPFFPDTVYINVLVQYVWMFIFPSHRAASFVWTGHNFSYCYTISETAVNILLTSLSINNLLAFSKRLVLPATLLGC